MSVHGALNNAVSGQLIEEVLQDSLSALTRTACFIKSLSKPVTGPAGNDIDIVHKLNTNRSGSYRGSPVVLDVQKDDHYTGRKRCGVRILRMLLLRAMSFRTILG